MTDTYEDELDIAIPEEDTESIDINDIDDVVDVDIDYSDVTPSPEMEDIDADDYIAAEREIFINPFDDDEIIDAAINGNTDIDEPIIDNDEEE